MMPKVASFCLSLVLLLPLAAAADPVLPVENGVVTSKAGWRQDPFGSGRLVYHRGTDIAVPVGTPVKAVRPGRVALAGWHGAYGVAVILEHADGSRTLYGHNALARVQPGETVEAGAVIALSGNSGRSTGPHVHFEELSPVEPLPALAAASPQQETSQAAVRAGVLLQEQRLEAALNAALRRINRLPEEAAVSALGGGQEEP
ncbi:M23 family metallopeptidase [Trichlorobacter ammonificans]|uniref:Peptidase family M23 n=1 Tax=Trichlorobacter ammonificans TaxID=2916410 RepID=A0ABM9D589_9BACT|nr:M23 family metallopeptidase [Trichlorobacter ammonificans]CAH2030399.1 Peptidase family M23 [Trichlorobacter ammonificans]